MSDFVVEILGRTLGDQKARRLVDAGLLDSSRFQYRKPIDVEVARLLHDLKSLRVIQFHEVMPDARSLELLNYEIFAKRKEISFRVFGYGDRWADISILRNLPEVERFDWESVIFGSIEPLYSLRKLVHLGIGLTQPKPKISLDFVLNFSESIESLSIDGDYKNTLTVIPQLKKLRSVWFVSTKFDGFDFLEGLPIETLGNYGGRVGSFEFLRKLKTIRRLWIKTNSKIEDIDFIEDLPNLERIELLYLARITRFPKCVHLKKLKLIFAYECNRLTDISELQKLSGVKVSVCGKALKDRWFRTNDFSLSEALDAGGRYL